MRFKKDLATSFSKLGWIYQYQLYEVNKAKDCYNSAKKLWSELVLTFPGYNEFSASLIEVNEALQELF